MESALSFEHHHNYRLHYANTMHYRKVEYAQDRFRNKEKSIHLIGRKSIVQSLSRQDLRNRDITKTVVAIPLQTHSNTYNFTKIALLSPISIFTR